MLLRRGKKERLSEGRRATTSEGNYTDVRLGMGMYRSYWDERDGQGAGLREERTSVVRKQSDRVSRRGEKSWYHAKRRRKQSVQSR